MKAKFLMASVVLFGSLSFAAEPATPKVFIVVPANNAVVESPVTIKFGLDNMAISPAGVPHENGGHHHLLVDAPLPDLTQPIPNDAQHLHFGKGQTETTLELTPGEHTLQLLVGDFAHRPHAKPVYSEVVKITVKAK